MNEKKRGLLINTHTHDIFSLNTKEKWVPINNLVSAGLEF